jgi:polyisoprenoid-binding protein YceI
MLRSTANKVHYLHVICVLRYAQMLRLASNPVCGKIPSLIGYLTLIPVLAWSVSMGESVFACSWPMALRSTTPASSAYVLDSSQSKFIAHAYAGGLFWFKGHDHYLAAKQFTGEVELTPNTIVPASLHLIVKTGSLVETGAVFTDAQKQIINKEVREIVLQPDQFPEIVFKSTAVVGKLIGNDTYQVEITGDLTLHGVTRRVTIPAKVTLSGNDLRAVGEFRIDRGDYKVKATSAFHGLVRVRNKVKFEFDIVGHRA